MNYLRSFFNGIINVPTSFAPTSFANIVDGPTSFANIVDGPTSFAPTSFAPTSFAGSNEGCKKQYFKPNFLEQGRTLQRERSNDLKTSVKTMNKRINNIEGFTTITANKNSAQTTDTTTLSNDFDKKIERYDKEYPVFIDETRNSIKTNTLNNAAYDNFYGISYKKEGCYKSAGASGLELQSDMKDVTVQTCKMRASDLGYSGFAINKGTSGQSSCYLSKDISLAKTGGVSTKTMTSLAFKTSTSANMGALLNNGQLGIYNNTIDNNLVTDLPGIDGCNIDGSNILINDKSVVATYGLNCKAPVPAPAPAPAPPPDKNKIALGFITNASNYLNQLQVFTNNLIAYGIDANNNNSIDYARVSMNYITAAIQQVSSAISNINSNNSTQAVASLNTAIGNIQLSAKDSIIAYSYLNSDPTIANNIAVLGANGEKFLTSAINALS